MEEKKGYGVVYTPLPLANFVARILLDELYSNPSQIVNEHVIVDPACGESVLLDAVIKTASNMCPNKNIKLIGIDVEENVIKKDRLKYIDNPFFDFLNFDSILPTTENVDAYWKNHIPRVSATIANPPWSSNRIYEQKSLFKAGYRFTSGQYDSYVLFIELCLKLVKQGGYCAFILPDSIFSGENKTLRDYLSEKYELRLIARLGEKLFPNINRATSVMIIKKNKPSGETKTRCFRLTTDQRKQFLENKTDLYSIFTTASYEVSQARFRENNNYTFNIDTREEEEMLLRKIETNAITWAKIFRFGRGVEISKSGLIVTCSECGQSQGFSKKQQNAKKKKCIHCGSVVNIKAESTNKIISNSPNLAYYKKILVGENIFRYTIKGERYIKLGVNGINYKEPKLYDPPKILIRKTGLGINACLDYSGTYITQTVYSCNYIDVDNDIPLEYYLGVLNSRVMFYYYIKIFGENEWKSHPYLTKEILFSLPVKKVNDYNKELCLEIAEKTKKISEQYSRYLDIEIENLIIKLYDIDATELGFIVSEMEKLPNLSAINHMKFYDYRLDNQL